MIITKSINTHSKLLHKPKQKPVFNQVLTHILHALMSSKLIDRSALLFRQTMQDK